jgi:ketosteroid isomerase-like protein
MKSITYKPMLLITVLIGIVGCNQPKKTSRISFDSALAVHMDAIKNTDLAKLEPTVHDSVTLILPSGERIKTKVSFMDFHKNWFQLKNYVWTPTSIKTQSTDSLGYAFIQYTYATKDSIGKVQSQNNNYLVLIFSNSKAGWQLIHDQNTAISAK